MRIFLTISVLVLLAVPASAQIDARKGEPFTLLVPWSVLYEDGYCAGCNDWSGAPILSANISPETILTAEFPTLMELQFEKTNREQEYVEAELRNQGVAVKLRFYTDRSSVQAEFDRAVSTGNANSQDTESRLTKIYDRMATDVFQGPLDLVPPDLRIGLLQYAHRSLGGADLGHATFRQGDYLIVNLGRDPSIYNTLQLNQSQRVARILNEGLLGPLKEASTALDGTGLAGVRLELVIPHRDFLSDSLAEEDKLILYALASSDAQAFAEYEDSLSDSLVDEDKLILYALASDAQAFAEYELTNQEFIDACVIIVNDNRIEVRLTDG